MEALWEAIAIVLGGQPGQPGPARGRRRGPLDPARARRGVRGDDVSRDRPSANLAGRPHHRPRPAGRRRHDHGRGDGHAAGARRRQGAGRHLRLHFDRVSDAHRHAGHDRGVRPDRVRAQRRGRVHLLDFRRRRHRADRVVGRRGPVCAPARRLDSQEAQGGALGEARPDHARLPPLPRAGDAGALGDGPRYARPVRGGALWHALRSAAVLPVVRPARAARGPAAAGERFDLRDRGTSRPGWTSS